MNGTRSRLRRGLAAVAAVGLSLVARPVAADPNEGETRPIHRDADRVYTIVAGEASGASTVTNPANLGFLRGVNGVLDLAWTSERSLRRGSGVGALLGIPLPFRIASVGIAYQFLYPGVPTDPTSGGPEPRTPDDPYSKVTLALAVPLERWVRGLSLGVNYSRLISASNVHATGVNQVDLGIAYWPSRFVALGLVGRALNVPTTGIPGGETQQPLVIDPEVAFRPLGTPTLELAVGTRIHATTPGDQPRFGTHDDRVEPRGRLFVTLGGVRLFAEAERMRFLPSDLLMGADARDAVKLTAGAQVDFGHVGIAGGVLTSAGGIGTFAVDGGVARVRISQERYDGIVIAPRRVDRLQLASYGGDRGMWKIIEQIDEVAERRGVVLVETRGMSLRWAQIEEVREALIRLRLRGGKVVTYMQGGALRHYFLAAVSDRIISHPTIGLSILGMRIQSFYFSDLLAKLGAKAEFVRIAEYKSVPEHYERMTSTEPAAYQRKLFVGDVWNHVLRVIARERGHDPLVVKKWIDNAPFHPPRAQREGIVDELAYPDELDEKLEDWLGRKVRIEKPSPQREHVHDFGPQPRIAVLVVEGDLLDGKSFTIPILGRKIAGSQSLTDEIEKLRKDPGVRAVVVRCNTPGGSVTASEEIARELDLTRKEKPVVISMGNACASGGYYFATAGQYIFSDATTATGSIGIFYPKMDLSGTLEKFGVGMDQKDFGRRAGLRSWFKPYSDDERAAALQDIQDSYAVFTGRVSQSRNMTLARVDKVARGRVWSGVRAAEVGLVDSYGGIREAVGRARAIAGLDADEGVITLYPEPPGILENLRRIFSFQLPSPLAGESAGAYGGAAMAAGTALLPRAVLQVLRHLPVSLWLAEEPVPLYLSEETIVIDG